MTEKDYKRILKERQIKYRANLNLPKDITFGIEIEYENVLNDLVSSFLYEEQLLNLYFNDWVNKVEFDLATGCDMENKMNGEINSPVLKDNIRTWKNLKTVLNILEKNNAVITSQCGAHVNIGTQALGFNLTYWRNFLLLWLLYEKEIYKFSSGEFKKVRTREDNIINRITLLLKGNIGNILDIDNCKIRLDIFKYLNSIGISLKDKIYDVSFAKVNKSKYEYDNRIEFRVPNGTLKEEIWQNYINFFAKFLIACKKELDVDKVVYKINHNEHNAIELADYIFEDNIDKDNFLIQALKTNKIYKKELLPHIEKY